ncbi:unnamed protein product [Lupinus luteus]|uniref:Vps72/YL1 C-terminal domain-containing protein n=1 Tax=Lupinus luteus TaxID=3873 RepID=A0AAV1XAS2_LUPLU
MEPEVVEAELVLPSYFSFKRVQMYEKYPKGQARGRHWKHLKQIIQAENYQNYPPDEPNSPYYDPRTNLRYANTDVFKIVRSLRNDYVQRYLSLRNVQDVLK